MTVQTSVTGKLNGEEFVRLWKKVTTYKVKKRKRKKTQKAASSQKEKLHVTDFRPDFD